MQYGSSSTLKKMQNQRLYPDVPPTLVREFARCTAADYFPSGAPRVYQVEEKPTCLWPTPDKDHEDLQQKRTDFFRPALRNLRYLLIRRRHAGRKKNSHKNVRGQHCLPAAKSAAMAKTRVAFTASTNL